MNYPAQMPPMPLPTEQEAQEQAVYYRNLRTNYMTVRPRTCWACGEPTGSPQHEVCLECASAMEE